MTDYTDPSTIDVDEVCANINHAFKMRGEQWTDQLSWPNITVKALADEIARLRSTLDTVATRLGHEVIRDG
jgi:hypothetical protein